MKNNDILKQLNQSKKKTLTKAFIQGRIKAIDFGKDCQVIDMGEGGIVIGDWEEIKLALETFSDVIEKVHIENDRRNSLINLLDTKDINARIEPGAVIREGVKIGDAAVVMMGACVNIGVSIGSKTLIDMNAVIGGGAQIGAGCHIGAGVVIKGVISSPDAEPVVIGDGVIIGPNAVIMENVVIGDGAVIRAGAIVSKNIGEGEVFPK
ncbi:2,3,4,5-tetrahydropyridine-2,6-dicarboxylate N-acetyltransferase [Bacillus sp. DNRA2]|uniref:DapH/DapD/GlmU-related protein n=1 Tax=Bacillus sp. DNRA2 TaxID=2723053 RepID=UPI00145E5475|nr:DapH/DapD/GlmU-related protein [Bacillus sp. DNRA2]NMD69144.1 2,3,4,5-tetrahydropyridine-2,6-dicarboxylate N-acetyltransferase [Bacillus sp. DNRA2]